MNDDQPSPVQIAARNRRQGTLLGISLVVFLSVLLPFLFWLYNRLCEVSGVAKSPNNTPAADSAVAAVVVVEGKERLVTVYFEARALDNLPVVFFPEHKRQVVRVGEDVENTYIFKNTSNQAVRFRPIHAVTPPLANKAYSMIVCFCFNDQEIEGGGEARFPVTYRFNADLDERVTMAEVRYDLVPITEEEFRTGNSGPGSPAPEATP